VIAACGRVGFGPTDRATVETMDGAMADGDAFSTTMCDLPCGLTDQGLGSDGCTNLKVLTLAPMTATTQGAYATGDTSALGPNTMSTCGGSGAPDAYYRVDVMALSTVDILVRPGPAYDTIVHFNYDIEQNCPGSTLACSNVGGPGADETIHAENVTPRAYLVVVDGVYTTFPSMGPYELMVQVTSQ
jgi:hypothetical protein